MFTYCAVIYTHLPANTNVSVLYTLGSGLGKQVKWNGYLQYIRVSRLWIQTNVNAEQFLLTKCSFFNVGGKAGLLWKSLITWCTFARDFQKKLCLHQPPVSRFLLSLLVRLFAVTQLWSSLEVCFAFHFSLGCCIWSLLEKDRDQCGVVHVPAFYLPFTSHWHPQQNANYPSQAGRGTGPGVQELLNWMIIGLSNTFLYCIVHSPACRIVQMRNSENSHAGTKCMLYGFHLLPLAHLDYMLRSPLYFFS